MADLDPQRQPECIPDGMWRDLLELAFYKSLSAELLTNPVIKNTPEAIRIDYVEAIRTLATMRECTPAHLQEKLPGGGTGIRRLGE